MKTFRLIFSCAFVLTTLTAFGATQCPGNVVSVQYHSLPHSHIGVSVTINGSGPYEFMVDTGAQITVIEPVLAQELKLETTGSLNIVTVASNVEVPLVAAKEVEVGPVALHGVEMAAEELGPIQADYPGLRGILGNNFLSRFDLLIDNSHKALCFDDSRRLQQSLRGERVPILPNPASDRGSVSAQAILISVHLPGDGKQGSVLRLDSGSNVPLLYVDNREKPNTAVHGGSTIGKQAQFVYAYTPERNVRVGAQREMQISFATPSRNGGLYSKPGEDGVLPTDLFKRVFISATDHFVIFDPH